MASRRKQAGVIYALGMIWIILGTLLTGYNVLHYFQLGGKYKEKTEQALKNWNDEHVILTLQIEKRLFETCQWNDGKVFVVFDGKELKN